MHFFDPTNDYALEKLFGSTHLVLSFLNSTLQCESGKRSRIGQRRAARSELPKERHGQGAMPDAGCEGNGGPPRSAEPPIRERLPKVKRLHNTAKKEEKSASNNLQTGSEKAVRTAFQTMGSPDEMKQYENKVKEWRDRTDLGLSVDNLATLIRRAQPKVEKNNE